MEGSSNGELKETQKVDSQDEDKQVIIQDAGDVKSVVDSEREIDLSNGNFVSADEIHGDNSTRSDRSLDEVTEPKEEGPQIVESGQVEEKEEFSESVVDSVQPVLSAFNDIIDGNKASIDNLVASNNIELEKKEKVMPLPGEEVKGLKDNSLPSLKETNVNEGLKGTQELAADEVLKGIEETNLPILEEKIISFPDADALKETGDANFSSPEAEENNGISDATIPYENNEVPLTITDAVSKGIEDTKLQDLDKSVGESSAADEASEENANDESQPLANIHAVDTSNALVQARQRNISEGTGNPTIISVSPRHLSSWKSCCGLLDILHSRDK
ncbi:hypothetical protein O6P43_014802 [Quillaja saponaria]|uniref:Uncharacterized protein n=1 Tax=Quillaja saponaria TaxID=32244 RepID=A0AAD7PRR4_QUISA|nr:hypothetical protein O6P43_014802 [Quillaja saponaria]